MDVREPRSDLGVKSLPAPVMESGGGYSRQNRASYAVAERLRPWLVPAAEAVLANQSLVTPSSQLQARSVFTYCDFGAADCGAATSAARVIIDTVHEKEPKRAVQVIMEDQQANDFGPFFRHFQKLLTSGPEVEDSVFVSAVGRSFYKQCVPNGCVDLALCCNSAHWHDSDTKTSDSVSLPIQGINLDFRRSDLEVPTATEETGARSIRAERELVKFLLHRARELRAGGRLVLVNFCKSTADDAGPEKKAFEEFTLPVVLLFEALEQCVADGRLTKAEQKRFAIPSYVRDQSEIQAPFLDADSDVRRAGLRMVSLDVIVVECTSRQKFLSGTIDLPALAQEIAECTRSWSHSIVWSCLDEARPKEEKAALVDAVYNKLAELMAKKGNGIGLPYLLSVLVAEKQPSQSV